MDYEQMAARLAQLARNATPRPFSRLKVPRRRGPGAEPLPETQERVRWIEWIREQIIADTPEGGDHWLDPRWEEIPPEWRFEVWKSRACARLSLDETSTPAGAAASTSDTEPKNRAGAGFRPGGGDPA